MREYGPGHPLVFSHIPKTAGTSLRALLQQQLQPAVFVQGLDRSLIGGYDDLDALSPAARASIHLDPDELPADATLVAGHIAPATTMARYPGADHVTFLRNPQVRVISQWLHSRSVSEFDLRHWGPSADAFRIGRRPLREYLEHVMIAPSIDNTITRFLAWPHQSLKQVEFIDEADDEQVLAAALARLDTFAHVNVMENPRFMPELGAWLGTDLPDTRLNERTSVPPRMRPDLVAEVDHQTRALLDHRTRLDSRVWEHVARRVLPGADPKAVLETALQDSIERYTVMLAEPDDARTARRVVERLYEVGIRLDPRRRSRTGVSSPAVRRSARH